MFNNPQLIKIWQDLSGDRFAVNVEISMQICFSTEVLRNPIARVEWNAPPWPWSQHPLVCHSQLNQNCPDSSQGRKLLFSVLIPFFCTKHLVWNTELAQKICQTMLFTSMVPYQPDLELVFPYTVSNTRLRPWESMMMTEEGIHIGGSFQWLIIRRLSECSLGIGALWLRDDGWGPQSSRRTGATGTPISIPLFVFGSWQVPNHISSKSHDIMDILGLSFTEALKYWL